MITLLKNRMPGRLELIPQNNIYFYLVISRKHGQVSQNEDADLFIEIINNTRALSSAEAN